MHVEYLYYFRDFSKTLSISKTAAEHYMTPQGLSRALHQLEKDFGVTLLSYRNNVVSLTPAGAALKEKVDPVIEAYEQACGALIGYKLAAIEPPREVVRVTATSCVSRYLLSLLDLQRPGLFPFSVRVNESNIYRIAPQLPSRDSEASFGIISIPSTERYSSMLADMVEREGMSYRPLIKSPLVAMVSSFSPLAKLDCISSADIEAYPIARVKDEVLGDALDDYVKEDNVKTVTNASAIVYNQIVEHQAIGFAPKLAEGMAILPSNIVLKPTKGFFATEFGIVADSANADSQLVMQTVKYISDMLKKSVAHPRYAGTYELI